MVYLLFQCGFPWVFNSYVRLSEGKTSFRFFLLQRLGPLTDCGLWGTRYRFIGGTYHIYIYTYKAAYMYIIYIYILYSVRGLCQIFRRFAPKYGFIWYGPSKCLTVSRRWRPPHYFWSFWSKHCWGQESHLPPGMARGRCMYIYDVIHLYIYVK